MKASEETSQEVRLWTDASFGDGQESACACIARVGGVKRKLVVYLGAMSSSDAELLGGVFAVCLAEALLGRHPIRLNWFCDCKSVVEQASTGGHGDSAEESYWGAWQYLQARHDCQPQFLSRTTRAPEHLACDRASRWIRISGKKLLTEEHPIRLGRLAAREPELAWHLLDGRPLAQALLTEDTASRLTALRVELQRLFTLA